ncbi:hypothetical protein ABH899_005711 [Paenibacillus sp. RC84]
MVKLSLEELARLWFNRSPLQHSIIVRNIQRTTKTN